MKRGVGVYILSVMGRGGRRAYGGQCEVLRNQCCGDLSSLGTLDLESKTIPEPDGRSSLAFGQDLRIGPWPPTEHWEEVFWVSME